MSDYILPPPAQPYVPVQSGGRFAVRRIFCVGRNYAEHAREMGHDPAREPPFFFTKPADSLVIDGADTPYPSATSDLHYEIELVVAIGKEGADIVLDTALEHVIGYAPGIDLTRRDLQAEAKKLARPWDMAKGFDHSAPIGALVLADKIGPPLAGRIALTVNGETKQQANLRDMIWGVGETVAYLSTLVRLMPGDLIFTGTPAGVGPAVRGDVLEGHIAGLGKVTTKLV